MSFSAKSFWRWVAGIATLLVALGIAVGLVLTIIDSPQRGMTLVEVLRLFISWPAIVGLLSLVFGITFRNEIGTFIQNIATIRVGNAEILSKQPPTPAGAAKDDDTPATPATPDGSIRLTAEELAMIRQGVEKLQGDVQTEKSTREQVIASFEQALQEKQNEAIWWWFRYLDYFLVINTKRVLGWVASQGPVTRELLHEEWKLRIPSAKEREVILSALLNNQLLGIDASSLLHVTDAGQAYLRHVRDNGGGWMLG